jgi:hypothetical protein
MAKRGLVGWAFVVAILGLTYLPSNAAASNTCGLLTEPCCTTPPCVAPMVGMCSEGVCDPDSFTCVPCGGIGQPCCLTETGSTTAPTASCNAGLICVGITDTTNGTCRPPTAPALSASGLAATAFMLVLAGLWVISRRRRAHPSMPL